MTHLSAQRRYEVRVDDMRDPQRAARALNEALRDMSLRLEALEAAKGVTTLDELAFDTGATVTPLVAPFSGGRLRVACPFTPTGVTLLRVDQVLPAGQPVSTQSSDVKWRFAAGADAGAGAVVVDFITGLNANSSYKVRLGVTRG